MDSRVLAAGAAAAFAVGVAALLAPGSPVNGAQEKRRETAAELRAMRVAALRSRAIAEGTDEAKVDDALEAPNPKATSIDLFVQELCCMKLIALYKRALSMGVDGETVEDAMEADDGKSALIKLIVDTESKRGPAERMVACLRAGGTPCAEMLHGVLDHAMDVLEQLSVSSPRKARKALLEIMERVQRMLDAVDDERCDGICHCTSSDHESLTGQLMSVQDLSPTSSVSLVSDTVAALLDGLDRRGDTVLQSLGVLRCEASGGSCELVDRGRADVVDDGAGDGSKMEPELEPDDVSTSDGIKMLRCELQALRVKQIRGRATAEGLSEDAVDSALDADNPKAALIDLIVQEVARRGPLDRTLRILAAGGEASAEMVRRVLDHALDMLEELSMASPRKSRKAIREVIERVESVAEFVDGEWCDGVSRCGREELDHLSGAFASVHGMSSSTSVVSDACGSVSALLECLDRCGSVVVQTLGVLCDDGGGDGTARSSLVVDALECLSGLSEARQGDSVCADEAAAYEAVKRRLSAVCVCMGAEVVPICMSLFTLGCRNGLTLCGSAEMVELSSALCVKWVEGISGGGEVEYDTGAAVHCLWYLTSMECGPKMPSESRVPVEKTTKITLKRMYSAPVEKLTEQRVREIFVGSMQARILTDEDISLACGWSVALHILGIGHMGALPAAEQAGVFSAALALRRRVEPSPLSSKWWSNTCNVVEVTSARLVGVWAVLVVTRRLPMAMQCIWYGELLDYAIQVSKMNASASLSDGDTMALVPVIQALSVVEGAAQDESYHEMLNASGVIDALEYAILHDSEYIGYSTAAYAAGAGVGLVGRNEGGKVLRREAVHAVLSKLQACFQPDTPSFTYAAKAVLTHLTRVATVAVSDANKKHMLQYESLIDTLLQCLIIDDDNRRKGQDGADALQEASAGMLHELSLYGPGAEALRSRPNVLSTLHTLCEVGTRVSRERGAAALFELEQETWSRAVSSLDGGDRRMGADSSSLLEGNVKPPPPHVMMSYNWDHQEVILRVVGSLQHRGYLVWVDTEQMKGATVDTMALAVEGSAVVLLGVSRAYKESSNCRMEAQYALQKKKPLVPLMLVGGYEADGWLGLLLGTSMWYGFYGETLSDGSAFQARMDALSRDIGGRGRVDAVPATSAYICADPSIEVIEDAHADDDLMTALVLELQQMKMLALQRRACSAGVPDESVEDAMESNSSKSALIGLIVAVESRRGPADRVGSCLEAGGNSSAEVLSGVLEHAMEVLSSMSASSPRKARKNLVNLIECADSLLESVDADWCDGVSRCGGNEIKRLSGMLVAVQELSPSSGASDASDAVTAALSCLERCGNVVVQSMSVVSAGGADGSGSAFVVSALESLRGLSEERLDAVSADEVAAFDAVRDHVFGLDECFGDAFVSGCMALHTLGCRNGTGLCGRAEVVEGSCDMLIRWLQYASGGGDDCDAGAACGAYYGLVNWYGGAKIPPESRGPVERIVQAGWARAMGTVGKLFHEAGVRQLHLNCMKSGIMSCGDLSLACGWGFVLLLTGSMHPSTLATANEAGVFSNALTLYHRVEPSPLPNSWWTKTRCVIDVTSCRLACLAGVFGSVKRLPSAPQSAIQSSWWSDALDHALRLVKLNASAGLSACETMCLPPILQALSIVELAAQDESQHQLLLESGVTDALEYAILHDFPFGGTSIAAAASGAAVSLVGRREGGKVLRCEAVHAVLDRVHAFFRSGSAFSGSPPGTILVHFKRVIMMSVSDANKKHMLQFEPLIDMLLECLIINDDNQRKGQDGADQLQEASSGVIHELSLYGPGAAALRSHPDVIKMLHKLCEVGTKVSKERGAAALFELEEDKRTKHHQGSSNADDGSGTGLSTDQKPPPHVMASYNWDHQDVILRVVASLQERGYLVWVDTEQMKGATVDTMALAVEGSEVVMIGVSRAYKESSNCRMEAQYALQKKKPLIPLMLTQGYEADGWLGLLLGTSMWYGFHGAVLCSASAFEDRMDALCRELGDRGRADTSTESDRTRMVRQTDLDIPRATARESSGPSLSNPTFSQTSSAMTRVDAMQLRLGALVRHAVRQGIDASALDDAENRDDPHGAIVDLLFPVASVDAALSLRGELVGLPYTSLVRKAIEFGVDDESMDTADNADDASSVLIELIIQAQATARVEDATMYCGYTQQSMK